MDDPAHGWRPTHAGGALRYDLDATSVLNVGDTVVMIGSADALQNASTVFREEAISAGKAAPVPH